MISYRGIVDKNLHTFHLARQSFAVGDHAREGRLPHMIQLFIHFDGALLFDCFVDCPIIVIIDIEVITYNEFLRFRIGIFQIFQALRSPLELYIDVCAFRDAGRIHRERGFGGTSEGAKGLQSWQLAIIELARRASASVRSQRALGCACLTAFSMIFLCAMEFLPCCKSFLFQIIRYPHSMLQCQKTPLRPRENLRTVSATCAVKMARIGSPPPARGRPR